MSHLIRILFSSIRFINDFRISLFPSSWIESYTCTTYISLTTFEMSEIKCWMLGLYSVHLRYRIKGSRSIPFPAQTTRFPTRGIIIQNPLKCHIKLILSPHLRSRKHIMVVCQKIKLISLLQDFSRSRMNQIRNFKYFIKLQKIFDPTFSSSIWAIFDKSLRVFLFHSVFYDIIH